MLSSLFDSVIPWWKTKTGQQPLQDGASSDLCLAHPTPGECEAIYRMSFVEWGDALTLDEYLEESKFLQSVPLAKDNGMLSWILTDGSPPDRRPILCSCETFFKSALIANSKVWSYRFIAREIFARLHQRILTLMRFLDIC